MMTGSAMPLLVVPLRDGTEARLTATMLAIGAREFAVGRISVARQVSPDPVTIALLVAGTGMVEFQPARPEDGAVILEGIFRLRPELRTPGFEPPAVMPSTFTIPATARAPQDIPFSPEPGGWPGVAGAAVPRYPIQGAAQQPLQAPRQYNAAYGPPEAYRNPYAVAPIAPQPSDGRVGRYPRTAFQVVGAAVTIYFTRLLRWLALGLLVALIPSALGTLWSDVFEYAVGIDPTQPVSAQEASNGMLSYTQNGHAIVFGADPQRLLTYGGIALGAFFLCQLFTVYRRAVLAAGTRDALLGRTPRVGGSLASGLRRFFPVLGASLLLGLVMLAMAAIEVGCFASAYYALDVTGGASGSAVASSPLIMVGMVGGILMLPVLFVWVYLWGRLLLAPYIAATERVGGASALARSWRLTRRQWWHTAFPILFAMAFAQLVLLFCVAAFGVAVDNFYVGEVFSVVVAALVAPLTDIASTGALFDLRLRAEGYASVVGEPAPSAPPEDSAVAAGSRSPVNPQG